MIVVVGIGFGFGVVGVVRDDSFLGLVLVGVFLTSTLRIRLWYVFCWERNKEGGVEEGGVEEEVEEGEEEKEKGGREVGVVVLEEGCEKEGRDDGKNKNNSKHKIVKIIYLFCFTS